MGVADPLTSDEAARAVRRRHGFGEDDVVLSAFGGITPEKRIEPILQALAVARRYQSQVRLLLVGQEMPHFDARAAARALGVDELVTVAGYVETEELPAYLAASDVVLSLRWPSARETSASWLRAIAAGRATVVTDLAQQADLPTLDPRSWTVVHAEPTLAAREPVAVSIDILDEAHSLTLALKRLTTDAALRARLGAAARAHWAAAHTVDRVASAFDALLGEVSRLPDPVVTLPSHLRPDAAAHARAPDRRVSGGDEASRERESARKLTWCPPPIRQRVWSEPGAWWRSSSGWRWRARCCSCLRVRPFLPPAGSRRHAGRRRDGAEGRWPRACRWRGRQCRERWLGHVTVREVPPGSAAAAAGLRPGDVVVHARSLLTGHAVDLSSPPRRREDAMRRWREAYRLGTRGPLDVSVRHADGSAAQVRRWNGRRPGRCRGRRRLGAVAVQLGPIVEMVSIVGAAVVLLLLRPRETHRPC